MVRTNNTKTLVVFDQELHLIGEESTEMSILGLEEGTEYQFSIARSSNLVVANYSQPVSITIDGKLKINSWINH